MARISEVITIYAGMSNTVNLRYEFSDLGKNRKRMQGYKPIESQRKIFLKIAKSFLPTENKVHLLVGHYGTGKSHLLLMLANYFSQTLTMPELTVFFENFDQADKHISSLIQNLRGTGRYLVVIPDYESQEDFSENLLSALEEAFKREGMENEINSIYKEALRVLNQWESDETSGVDPLHKFTAFQDAIGKEPGIYNSLITLKNGLKNYKQAALNIFKDVYDQLIRTPFRYSANNIVAILEDMIASKYFRNRFEGIVFLYDEFDYTLSNRRISIEVVEKLAELCKNSNAIVFIGSLHRELSAFGNEYSVEDFKTVQQRFKTIDMRTEGLEEIVAAIVHVEKNNPIFQKDVAPNLQQVYHKVPDIQRLGLFNWLESYEIQEKIIDVVYPLHPLAMACLLKLSTTIGSSNRTLFTFLGGEGIDEDNEYSYKAFIEKTDIFDRNGLLSLYTTDYLVDYFRKELDIDNTDLRETIKKTVISYHSSLKELKNRLNQDNTLFDISDPIYNKILKLMLVFNIVGIPNNQANLFFGLNLQIKEKNRLKNVLKLFTRQMVFFYNDISKVYEFRTGTGIIDWKKVISVEKQQLIQSGEFDVAEGFLDIYKVSGQERFLSAKKYNSVKSTDRQLLRAFEMVKDFGQKKELEDGTSIDYFDYCERELFENRFWKDSYDGVVIYIIVETNDDIKQAKKIARNNSSDYVLVVVPEIPIPIKDSFLELKACLTVKNSDEYRNAPIGDQVRLDESYTGDINKGYVKQYIDKRTKYFGGRLGTWYGKDGTVIENNPSNEQEPVYNFLTKLYGKFNNLADEEVNRCHKSLTHNKRFILRDAINCFLEAGRSIEIDTSFGNDKGFIRYLKNIFFDKQLLKKVGQEGTLIKCEIEKDTSKYEEVFPALADMIGELKSQVRINVPRLINKYRHAPYGLGEVSLELFVGYFIKYFGDELSYKTNPNDPGEISIQSFDQLAEIVNKPMALAIFEKRELDDVHRELLLELYRHFSQMSVSIAADPQLREVVAVMKSWYDKLPKLAQSEDFYADEKIKRFLQLMRLIDPSDSHHFIFEKMQTIWGYEEDDRFDNEVKISILKGVKIFDKVINNTVATVEDKILRGFLRIFKAQGITFGSLEQAIEKWYNSLDTNQRDISGSWHNPNSQPLTKYLKNTQNLREVLFDKIPGSNDYGLGKVSNWNINNISIYLDKVKEGLEKIEANRILVDMPILECGNAEKNDKSPTETVIQYENKKDLMVSVQVAENASEVWLSYQGKDPKESNVQKHKAKGKQNIVPTRSNQTIKLVSVDKEGNYSQVLTLYLKEKFVDRIKKNIWGYEIDKPKDAKDAQSVIKSLIFQLVEDNFISRTELANTLRDLAEEIRNEN